jgi:hypothetical protein
MLLATISAATALAFAPPAGVAQRAVAATRASTPALFFKQSEDESATAARPSCHLLSSEEQASIANLLSDTDSDYGFIACDQPSDDPLMTCFLKPDSWRCDESLGDGEWLCMHNPTSNLTPNMSSEDSY